MGCRAPGSLRGRSVLTCTNTAGVIGRAVGPFAALSLGRIIDITGGRCPYFARRGIQ